MTSASDEDAELMRRIGEGDTAAYRRLVEEHLGSIVTFAYRLLNSREEAEDVAQETFLRVWQNADRYEPTARLTTWLHTIARNQAVDRLRRRRPTTEQDALDRLPTSDRPSDFLERKRAAEGVQEALGGLAPRQREAIVLVHYQGLSHGEAAQLLGIGVEAVESLLGRARRKLRSLLVAADPARPSAPLEKGS